MIRTLKSDPLVSWIADSMGYLFEEPSLARAALTHRSAGDPHNERLEFLGDSVLNLCVAHLLYDANPGAHEGALSRQRATLVNRETLAAVASDIGLGRYLRLGAGEQKSGGARRSSILADALEALIGAIYLDGGLAAAAAAVRRILEGRLKELPAAERLKDPKTLLQELLQARGLALPVYSLTATSGDAHRQSFAVSCAVPALGLVAAGEGSSRRRAEQEAARKLLERLSAEAAEGPDPTAPDAARGPTAEARLPR